MTFEVKLSNVRTVSIIKKLIILYGEHGLVLNDSAQGYILKPSPFLLKDPKSFLLVQLRVRI